MVALIINPRLRRLRGEVRPARPHWPRARPRLLPRRLLPPLGLHRRDGHDLADGRTRHRNRGSHQHKFVDSFKQKSTCRPNLTILFKWSKLSEVNDPVLFLHKGPFTSKFHIAKFYTPQDEEGTDNDRGFTKKESNASVIRDKII